MNENDKANLNFLLSCSPDVLKDWHNKMSEDDILYAKELLLGYRDELSEMLVELKMLSMDSFPQVEEILKKYKIN